MQRIPDSVKFILWIIFAGVIIATVLIALSGCARKSPYNITPVENDYCDAALLKYQFKNLVVDSLGCVKATGVVDKAYIDANHNDYYDLNLSSNEKVTVMTVCSVLGAEGKCIGWIGGVSERYKVGDVIMVTGNKITTGNGIAISPVTFITKVKS